MSLSPLTTGDWVVEEGRAPKRFWHALDWWAAGATAFSSFVAYLVTLAPSVTLEDSGELVTAAHGFGVPHPPGYPVWTLVTWVWIHFFPIGNIAWRANLLSAIFAALAAGLVALLVSRSGRVMAVKLISREESIQQRLPLCAAAMGGAVAGWMLAFSPAMWSQAVIAEVYTMNVFVWMAVLVGLYRWSFDPQQRWRLYLAAWLWGVGLGVHQTMVLAAVALPMFVWLADREVGRDLLAVVLALIVAAVGVMALWAGSMFHQGLFSAGVLGSVAVGAAVWLWWLWRSGPGFMRHWRVVLGIAGAAVAGLLFYCYEPVASRTNPSMNLGYTQTWQGFLHHIGRAQYAAVETERTLLQLWAQLNVFLYDLQAQFHIVVAVAGLGFWFFFRELTRFSRDWLWFLLVAFLSFGLGFVFLSNPPYEKLRILTDRVFFLPSYCVYAMWIGYTLALGLVFILRRRVDVKPWAEWWILAGLGLPVISLLLHGAESSQRYHTFGYDFGYRLFKPGGGYTEMERNAVLLGGSDAGRFVPTYMVFVESRVPSHRKTYLSQYPDCVSFDRRDVYVLSQNMLADRSYLRALHDQYGAQRGKRADHYPPEPLWLPTAADWQAAAQQASAETEAMKQTRAPIRQQAIIDGINGNLSLRIFEANKSRHSFYVEEGNVLPWMYPYLEPHGLIMRLQPQPVMVLDPSVIGRDRRYWDEQARRLLPDVRFQRDPIARLVYSRARAAIAGLYAHHRMTDDAEYAYRQALELYPDNEDAVRRLAQLLVQLDRFDDALWLLNDTLRRDSYNIPLREAVNQIQEFQKVATTTKELEAQRAEQPGDFSVALQLLASYARRQRLEKMEALTNELLAQPSLSAANFLKMADVYAGMRQWNAVAQLLQ